MKIFAWILIGVVAIGGVVGLFFAESKAKEKVADAVLVVANDDHTRGPDDAKATLVTYIDFESERSRIYFSFLEELEKEFPNDLQIVYRYLPHSEHNNNLPATLAVEAAARQDKFYEMVHILFAEQKKWSEKSSASLEIFEEYALKLGLDVDKFKKDFASQAVKERVERDIVSGEKLKIEGTPGLFLNKKNIHFPANYKKLKKLIQSSILKDSSN